MLTSVNRLTGIHDANSGEILNEHKVQCAFAIFDASPTKKDLRDTTTMLPQSVYIQCHSSVFKVESQS